MSGADHRRVSDAERIPARIGRYQVVARIGAGGMAEVFSGSLRGEAGFERRVAIKRVRPELGADPRYDAWFLEEARLAAAIRSPHVVSVIDSGRDPDGRPFLVMDLVAGVTLEQLARARALPLDWILSVAIDVASALADAHETVDV